MNKLAMFAAALLAAASVHAQSNNLGTCTDASRACLIASAMTYVEGLWKADGKAVRFAPAVRRTHNGGNRPEDGDALIRERIAKERLTGYRNLRLVVDEKKGDVFAFWVTAGPLPQTAHIAERIRVEKGLITQIEIFVALDNRPADQVQAVWPDEDMAKAVTPPPADIGPCAGARRDCLIAVANTYLDGLMTADGSKVKFAPNVRRTQNGGRIQEGEASLRASVAKERLAFRRNFRAFADERSGNVVAVWLTGTDTPTNKSTAHVIERLKVERGLITEIEVFYPLEQGTLEGTSGWPDE